MLGCTEIILHKILLPSETAGELEGFADEFAGKTIFFPGGGGLIGRWFFESFAMIAPRDPSIKCVVAGRSRPVWLKDKFGPIDVSFLPLDLLSVTPQHKVFRIAETFDQVWFFSAPTARETFEGKPGIDKFRMSLKASLFLEDIVKAAGSPYVLLASSGVAVKGALDRPVKEDEFGAPDLFSAEESHAQSKRVLERLLFEVTHQYGITGSIVRIFSCYGPWFPSDIHYALGNFIGAASRKEKIQVKSSGMASRSYSYASDLISMLVLEVLRANREKAHEGVLNVVNIGSSAAITIANLAKLVAEVAELPADHVEILGVSEASSGNRVRNIYVPDVSRAKSLGVYRERVALRAGLKSLFQC
jgi:UDP-glucuronate decarboxylase